MVMSPRTRLLVAAGVVAAALLTGCASHTPQTEAPATVAAEPSPTPSVGPMSVLDPAEHGTGNPEVDMGLISAEFVAGLQAIREYGPRVHPDVYTGIGGGIPGDPDVLRIYITDRSPEMEQAFLAASGLPAEKVAFYTSLRSEKDALALQQRIMDDFDSGAVPRSAVSEVTTFGPDADGLVFFGMTGTTPNEAQIDLLWERYGPHVRFETGHSTAIASPA